MNSPSLRGHMYSMTKLGMFPISLLTSGFNLDELTQFAGSHAQHDQTLPQRDAQTDLKPIGCPQLAGLRLG